MSGDLAPFLASGGHNGRRNAIRHILREAGRPLTTDEIINRLGELGVSIPNRERLRDTLRLAHDLVRVGRSTWQLNLDYPWSKPWETGA